MRFRKLFDVCLINPVMKLLELVQWTWKRNSYLNSLRATEKRRLPQINVQNETLFEFLFTFLLPPLQLLRFSFAFYRGYYATLSHSSESPFELSSGNNLPLKKIIIISNNERRIGGGGGNGTQKRILNATSKAKYKNGGGRERERKE